MYTITIKHADGFTSHINIFFGELINATRYCEGLKELNSKFGVHDEIYRIHDIGPNGIHIVREYKCGQWYFNAVFDMDILPVAKVDYADYIKKEDSE